VTAIGQTKKGAILSYAAIAFNVIAGLLYTPFLVRTLGLSDYGLFALSASLVGYFSIDLGLSAAITRFIARYRAEGNEHRVKELLGVAYKLYLIIDIAVFLLLGTVYLFADQIFGNLTPVELERFKNIFIVTSFFILFHIPLLPVNGCFIAYERVVALKAFDLANKIITVTLLILMLVLGFGLYGVVAVNILSTLTIQSIKLLYLHRKEGLAVDLRYYDKELLRSIGSFSLWATVSMIADKFFFSIIPALLAIFSNTREVAFFAIVISIEGYVFSMARALNGLFLPRVMRLVVREGTPEQQTDLLIRVGRIQLYIVGILIAGLIGLGKEFFAHWLGAGFDRSYYAMVLVLVPCLFHLTQTIAEELIYAQDKIRYRALSYVIGSVLSVTAIVLLAPQYGAIGAAIGVFLSFVVAHNIIIDIVYHRVLKIDMLRFLSACHLKILPVFIAAAGLGFLMQIYIDTPTLFLFAVKGVAWGFLCVALLWLFAMNDVEKGMIRQMVRMGRP